MSLSQPDRVDILIVDDDEGNRESLAEILGGACYDCATAADGSQALAFLYARRDEGNLPQLVLLDLAMPASTWAFRAEQAKDPVLDRVPVVIMSGVYQPEAAARNLGAMGHIPKPIDTDRLFAIVRQYCG